MPVGLARLKEHEPRRQGRSQVWATVRWENVERMKNEGGWLTHSFLKRLPREVAPDSLEGRSRLGELEGTVAVGVSVFLVVVKLWLWWRTQSVALLADAVNNAADIAAGGIVVISFRVARKPRDRRHPYGHGRVEAVATLVLATVLIGVAFEVARSGVERLVSPVALSVGLLELVVLGGTIGLKLVLALFAAGLARLTRSSTLSADAWNHAFDVLSTSLVFLAWFGAAKGWEVLDGWAALGVSALIGLTGYRYVRSTIDHLIGEAPDRAELRALHRIAESVPGVFGVHDVIVHLYGDRQLISLHIEVDAGQSALEVHELAEQVEQAVAEETGARVVVHADPVDHSHPKYALVAKALKDVLEEQQDVVGFHDLRLSGGAECLRMSVDLVVCPEVESSSFQNVLEDLAGRILAAVPEVEELDVGMEAEYASDQEYRRIFRRLEGKAVPV